VVASLEAARDAKSPIILQCSQGGAAYFAGKGVDNKNQEASIAGAVAAAHYIRSIAPIYVRGPFGRLQHTSHANMSS
jgi:fructose-bisphosphate aldolase class II